MDGFEDMETDFEKKALEKENKDLKNRILDLEKTLRVYGIKENEEEKVGDAEAICIAELSRMRLLSDQGIPLSNEDAKIFDLMHKNLLLALQKEGKKLPKGKETPLGDLIKIAKGSKDGKAN